jgi:hypothetical protein
VNTSKVKRANLWRHKISEDLKALSDYGKKGRNGLIGLAEAARGNAS